MNRLGLDANVVGVALLAVVIALVAGAPLFAQDDATAAVPTEAEALLAFLQAGAYRDFPHESAPHPSQGPHGSVQTYLDPTLAGSLEAGAATHPVGAAAVKELYQGGELSGWAVYVKTQADSDGGNGFYWYEVFSTTDPTRIGADGVGVPLCVGCHQAGRDFTLSPFPLQ